MPAASHKGAIAFGLVYIPVNLYNTVSEGGDSFNQLDRGSGARIIAVSVSVRNRGIEGGRKRNPSFFSGRKEAKRSHLGGRIEGQVLYSVWIAKPL